MAEFLQSYGIWIFPGLLFLLMLRGRAGDLADYLLIPVRIRVQKQDMTISGGNLNDR